MMRRPARACIALPLLAVAVAGCQRDPAKQAEIPLQGGLYNATLAVIGEGERDLTLCAQDRPERMPQALFEALVDGRKAICENVAATRMGNAVSVTCTALGFRRYGEGARLVYDGVVDGQGIQGAARIDLGGATQAMEKRANRAVDAYYEANNDRAGAMSPEMRARLEAEADRVREAARKASQRARKEAEAVEHMQVSIRFKRIGDCGAGGMATPSASPAPVNPWAK